MAKLFFIAASFFGMSAVILGAFGAHALKSRLTETLLHSYETAVQYQFMHALALLATTAIYQQYAQQLLSTRLLTSASCFFIAGIILFSGSLYLLSLTTLRTLGFINIGIVTPIGGLCFIIGWALLLVTALQQ